MAFFHLPKTGGTWVAQAVAAAGVQTWRPVPADGHLPSHGHASPLEVDLGDRFSVAFVRHPLSWWRSYWAYRMRVGWSMADEFDRAVASDDFNEFATRVLDLSPGHFDGLVGQFVGAPAPRVDFVGRFERLVEDTCTALRLGGEPFCEEALRAHPNVNVNDYDSFRARYRPDVAARLADAERHTIERFYPEDPVPTTLIAHGSCANRAPAGYAARARPPATGGELQRMGDRVLALERALERSHRAQAQLELALSLTRSQLGRTERALDSLQGSSVSRYTRPLRAVYHRTRDRRGLGVDRLWRRGGRQALARVAGGLTGPRAVLPVGARAARVAQAPAENLCDLDAATSGLGAAAPQVEVLDAG